MDREQLRDELTAQRAWCVGAIAAIGRGEPVGTDVAHLAMARAILTSATVNLTSLESHEEADRAHRAQGDALLSTMAEPPVTGGGVTLHLPDAFTAGEVNNVLREWAATRLTPVVVRRWLEEDDRLFWAIARLRGHPGGSTTADEEEARELIHVLTGDA